MQIPRFNGTVVGLRELAEKKLRTPLSPHAESRLAEVTAAIEGAAGVKSVTFEDNAPFSGAVVVSGDETFEGQNGLSDLNFYSLLDKVIAEVATLGRILGQAQSKE